MGGPASPVPELRARLAAAVSKFDESKVKRDDAGKFAEKEGGGADSGARHGTYNGAALGVLNSSIMHGKRYLADLMGQDFSGTSEFLGKMKREKRDREAKYMRESIAMSRRRMTEHAGERERLGIPDMPMGPNTHAEQTDGFVHGEGTKVRIFLKPNQPAPVRYRLDVLRDAWNALPDSARDGVKTLAITVDSSHAGYWHYADRTLGINLTDPHMNLDYSYDAANMLPILYHEIAHSMWQSMHESNPEGIARFIRTADEVGSGPTEYADTYFISRDEYMKKMAKFVREHDDDLESLSGEKREEFLREMDNEHDVGVGANEAHSAIMEFIAGGSVFRQSVNDYNMRRYVAAFARLHGIGGGAVAARLDALNTRLAAVSKFDESKHPRDDGGKFSEKEGAGESGPTYGTVAGESMKYLMKGIEKLLGTHDEISDSQIDILERAETELDGRAKRLAKLRDRFDIPDVPLGGPNTHTEETGGFVHAAGEGGTEIRADSSIMYSPAGQLHDRVLTKAWNSLPDAVRDRVKVLKISGTSKDAKDVGVTGSWESHAGILKFSISKNGSLLEHALGTFYHEIGHVVWTMNTEGSRGKAEKFEKFTRDAGTAPTEYAESYADEYDKYKKFAAEWEKSVRDLGGPDTEGVAKSRANLERNLEMMKYIYADESHADLLSIMVGAKDAGLLEVSADTMRGYISEFRSFHGLDDARGARLAALKTRLAAAVSKFDESKHKRDDRGRFSEKEGMGGGRPGETKSDDGGGNRGVDKYAGHALGIMSRLSGSVEAAINNAAGDPATREKLEKYREELRERAESVKSLAKKFPGVGGGPDAGPNTHTEETKGFRHGAGGLKVEIDTTGGIEEKLQIEAIRDIWNGLPDAVRNEIDTLEVMTQIRGRAAGEHDSFDRSLGVSLHKTAELMEPAGVFYHEVNHIRFSMMQREHPERVAQFFDEIAEIGLSPTEYSESYRDPDEHISNYIRWIEERGGIEYLSVKQLRMIEKAKYVVANLYANEGHSEFMTYMAMGDRKKRAHQYLLNDRQTRAWSAAVRRMWRGASFAARLAALKSRLAASAVFDESKHPRDDHGKFSEKEGGGSPGSTHSGPADDDGGGGGGGGAPHGTYGEHAARALSVQQAGLRKILRDHGGDMTEYLRKYLSGHVDEMRESAKKYRKLRAEAGFPDVPMEGPNTHPKGAKGFRNGGGTKISVTRMKQYGPLAKLHFKVVRQAWNDLPDAVRDRVKEFRIISDKNNQHSGSWHEDDSRLMINIPAAGEYSMVASDVFYHEIGHIRFTLKEESDRAAIDGYDSEIKSARARPITLYAGKYWNSEKNYRRKLSKWRKYLEAHPEKRRENEEEKQADVLRFYATRYSDESHSETFSIALGAMAHKKIAVGTDTVKKYMDAYKKLWGLDESPSVSARIAALKSRLAAAEFDESKHPRDDHGKFSKNPHGTYGGLARGTLSDFLRNAEAHVSNARAGTYEADIIRNDIKKVKDWLRGPSGSDAKRMGYPDVPLPGSNTHEKKTRGFKHGTKTRISDGMTGRAMAVQKIRRDTIRDAWNSLPDSVRDRVKVLELRESKAKRRVKLGVWTPSEGVLRFNIPDAGGTADIVSTFYHEIAHVNWKWMEDNHPGRVDEFRSVVDEVGVGTTAYADSYKKAAAKNARYEKSVRDRMRRTGRKPTAAEEETLAQNRGIADYIFANESHSELFSAMLGLDTNTPIKVSDAGMRKYVEAYKRMWGLEDGRRGSIAARIASLRERLAAEFDESKVKRDDDGKFAEKEGGGGSGGDDSSPASTHSKPAKDGSPHGTYGMLAGRSNDYLIKMGSKLIRSGRMAGAYEELFNAIKQAEKRRDDFGAFRKKFDIPDIPMEGENTHYDKTSGFLHGPYPGDDYGNIVIKSRTSANPVARFHRRLIRNAWNELPDYIRNNIRTLVLEDTDRTHGLQGSWDPDHRELAIYINERGEWLDRALDIFYHEIQHVRYDLKGRKNAKPQMEFDRYVKQTKSAPTKYAESWRDGINKYLRRMDEKHEEIKEKRAKGKKTITDSDFHAAVLRQSKTMRYIMGNETSSELFSLMVGAADQKRIIVPDEEFSSFVKEYRKLWQLGGAGKRARMIAARIDALKTRLAAGGEKFDESKHKRDDAGKFAEKEGGGSPGTTQSGPDGGSPGKKSMRMRDVLDMSVPGDRLYAEIAEMEEGASPRGHYEAEFANAGSAESGGNPGIRRTLEKSEGIIRRLIEQRTDGDPSTWKWKSPIMGKNYMMADGQNPAFSDYAYKGRVGITMMPPAEFLRNSASLEHPNEETVGKIVKAMRAGHPVDTPYLDIAAGDDGSQPEVRSHEGRHRAIAAMRAGIEEMPVYLYRKSGKWSDAELDAMAGGTYADSFVPEDISNARRGARQRTAAEFDESKHKRDDDGKFAEKEGGGSPAPDDDGGKGKKIDIKRMFLSMKRIPFKKDNTRNDWRTMDYPDGFKPDPKKVDDHYRRLKSISGGDPASDELHGEIYDYYYKDGMFEGGMDAFKNYVRMFSVYDIKSDPALFKKMDLFLLGILEKTREARGMFVEAEEKLAALNRLLLEEYRDAEYFYRSIKLDEIDLYNRDGARFGRSRNISGELSEFRCASTSSEITRHANGGITMKIPADAVRDYTVPAQYSMFYRDGGDGRIYSPEKAVTAWQHEMRIHEHAPVPDGVEFYIDDYAAHKFSQEPGEADERSIGLGRRLLAEKYGGRFRLFTADGEPITAEDDDGGGRSASLLSRIAALKSRLAAMAGQFDESKHPRDNDGKFAEKDGIDGGIDGHGAPQPGSGVMPGGYRAHALGVADHMIWLIDGVLGREGYSEDAVERLREYRKDMERQKKTILDISKNPDLPDIPAGPNTHSEETEGFKHGGKLYVDIDRRGTGGEVGKRLQIDAIREVWNSLPDAVRDRVKSISIARYGDDGTPFSGSFNYETGEFYMAVSDDFSPSDVIKTMYHEANHVRWHLLADRHPERARKYREAVDRIGMSPTKYSESYKGGGYWVPFLEQWLEEHGGIEGLDDLGWKNYNMVSELTANIYANESHSEFMSYLSGVLDPSLLLLNDGQLSEFSRATEELWRGAEVTARLRLAAAGKFDESKVKRDDAGKFAEKEGGGGHADSPASAQSDGDEWGINTEEEDEYGVTSAREMYDRIAGSHGGGGGMAATHLVEISRFAAEHGDRADLFDEYHDDEFAEARQRASRTEEWVEFDALCDRVAKKNGFYKELRNAENMCRAYNRILGEQLRKKKYVLRYLNLEELAVWNEKKVVGYSYAGTESGRAAEYKCTTIDGFDAASMGVMGDINARIYIGPGMRIKPAEYTTYPRNPESTGDRASTRIAAAYMEENEARLDPDTPVDWDNIEVVIPHRYSAKSEDEIRGLLPFVRRLTFSDDPHDDERGLAARLAALRALYAKTNI